MNPRPRRLPVTVALVRHETIGSYLHRLARANHLKPNALTRYVNAADDNRFEVLEALTGHRAERLDDLLVTSIHPRRHRRQEACRRCAAQSDILTPVHLAAPVHHTVCRSHKRWLTDDAGTDDGRQYPLHDLPEILRAQRRHRRLVRDHGVDQAADAVAAAEHITQRWTHRGNWPRHRNRRLQQILGPGDWRIDPAHPLVTMINYPETVALARLLADPHWTQFATSDDLDAIAAFHAEVGTRLHIPYQPHTGYDPLLHWQARVRAIRQYTAIPHLQ